MASDSLRLPNLSKRADSHFLFVAWKAGVITGIPANPCGHTTTSRLQSIVNLGAIEKEPWAFLPSGMCATAQVLHTFHSAQSPLIR